MARIKNIVAIQNIALIVKQVRKEKGMTQEALLFDHGIHFGRIEMGKSDMTCSTLIAVCSKLGITPVEFFKKVEKVMPLNFIP